MEDQILGLHHITAIASDAQRNLDFYTQVLGQRFLKKTINFDDPDTYHFYFGDEQGSAGTILTFFPWPGIAAGSRGTGQATEIGYSVPAGSFKFWMRRFDAYGVSYSLPDEQFGEPCLAFHDPDGLPLTLVIAARPDPRLPWTTADLAADVALRGLHHVALTVANRRGTVSVLTDIFGYTLVAQHAHRFRFATAAVPVAAVVDVVEAPNGKRGVVAGGSVHHVAFRVKDDAALLHFREQVLARGLDITPRIDRMYFHSLYFREPGGVLFEIATEDPGFDIDEDLAELGSSLRLPPHYEKRRAEIMAHLPPVVAAASSRPPA